MKLSRSVPPPARRSTPATGRGAGRRAGSSACAEIDLFGSSDSDPWTGFLRLRGDRPEVDVQSGSSSGVPPPARRSTLGPDVAYVVLRGSSACAEIDLQSGNRLFSITWFLRLRGDRPECRLVASTAGRVPPPARRSTRIVLAHSALADGSSACAEIDPCERWRHPGRVRFLRLRGDRPWSGMDCCC